MLQTVHVCLTVSPPASCQTIKRFYLRPAVLSVRPTVHAAQLDCLSSIWNSPV